MAARILMVDDEPHNLGILRIFLKALQYDVLEAECGQEALRIAERERLDLILLDVMLPDISGFDICKRLKQRDGFQTPIIFLSANAQEEAVKKGIELGAFSYLTKPFDLETLEATLLAAIGSSSQP
jgi:DNA-binding response OmpR family regulator